MDGWGLAVVDVSASGRQGRASKQQPPLLIALLVLFALCVRVLSDLPSLTPYESCYR